MSLLFTLIPTASAAPMAAVSLPPRPRPVVRAVGSSTGGGEASAPEEALPVPVGVELVTSLGTVDCTLEPAWAPLSVANFLALASGSAPWVDPSTGETTTRPLYDGTVFHRVVPGFLVQGGDPTGTGTGGPGYVLPEEPTAAVFDRPGLLGLANKGPNTTGSQFFVTLGPARHVDGQYSVIGHCDDLDVLHRIAAVPRGERNRPEDPPVLRAVRVKPAAP